jgi:3-hydroxyisobutyrate dehydrogenase-like beta-hydroxyacid dehydrogenase
MAPPVQHISILGLGHMGSALAHAFLDAGYPVTIWNRTPSKADPLVARGATVAASPARCVQSATGPAVIIISLVSDAAVLAVLRTLPTLEHRTVINYTSSCPTGITETADLVTGSLGGAGYLHGCIISAPSKVKTHDATVFYGGPRALFDRHRAICETLGEGDRTIWVSTDLP